MQFIRRSDAFSVCMLLDTHQLEPYQGHGYHLPHDIKEKPSGLGAFPAIFSFPGVSLFISRITVCAEFVKQLLKSLKLSGFCFKMYANSLNLSVTEYRFSKIHLCKPLLNHYS